jgi:hypothetical protein
MEESKSGCRPPTSRRWRQPLSEGGRNHSTSFTTGTRPVGSINAYASISIFVSILVVLYLSYSPPFVGYHYPKNLTGSSQPIRIVRFINRKAPHKS